MVKKNITNFKYIIAGLIVILLLIGILIGLIVYFTTKKNSSNIPPFYPISPTNPPSPTITTKPIPTTTIPSTTTPTIPTIPIITKTTTTMPPQPPIPGQIVNIPEWGGWATTTQDQEPNPIFPDGNPPNFSLINIGKKGNGGKIGSIKIGKSGETIDVIGTMGAAIPWAILSSIFGFKSRAEFTATVINSCNGTNPVPCCMIVQPINKFPNEIASSDSTNSKFPMINNLCNSNCNDINDPNVVATYNNGTKFPAYFIVPFQGCGGDCSVEFPDCFNSCPDVQSIVANFDYYTKCGADVSKGCEQIKLMSDNSWIMTPNIEAQFYTLKNATFAISADSQNGLNIVNAAKLSANPEHVNYCSGKNMHFDIQRTDPYKWTYNESTQTWNYTGSGMPYWCDLANCTADPDNSIKFPSNGTAPRGGNILNTMVRYILVPGNIFGNFNIQKDGESVPSMPLPPSCGGSGGMSNRCGDGKNWDHTWLCSQSKCSTDADCKDPNVPHCYAVSNPPCEK